MSQPDEPSLIVLRHSPELPAELWQPDDEGVWLDISALPAVGGGVDGDALVAQATGQFEDREDGAVAEVWEIRLTGKGKKRLMGEHDA